MSESPVTPSSGPPTIHEHRYVILGAGPGGLQMAYELDRRGADYVVLEKEPRAACFFETFPRQRRLISLNKRHNIFPEPTFNLRQDWNSLLSDDMSLKFTDYSEELYPHADDLSRYLQDFAQHFELKISYNTCVEQISRPDGRFHLQASDGDTFVCETLLCALGTVAPYIPSEIEGIELAIGYEEMSLDPDDYRGKRVAVIGQGNSAFETAEFLAPLTSFVHVLAKRPPKHTWDTHFTGDVRAANNGVFELFHLKTMHAVLAPRLRKLSRSGDTIRTNHEYDYPTSAVPGTVELTREYDVVIRACGFRWIPEWLFSRDIQPETCRNGRFPALTPFWESRNVDNLYFVGGAMASNDKQSASGFIHGFRYNIRTLARHLAELDSLEDNRIEMPEFDWDSFTDELHTRLSTTDALFALFGHLCDLLVVEPDGRSATLHRELPVAHVDDLDFGDRHVFTITMEFGFDRHTDPALSYLGPSDPNDPACGAFLHPIIRYRRGSLTDEFHFGDSLLGRWDRTHGQGGAVSSYEVDLQRWGYEKFGLDTSGLAEPVLADFRPWTPDEIEQWNATHDQAAVADEPDCSNQLSTSRSNWPAS